MKTKRLTILSVGLASVASVGAGIVRLSAEAPADKAFEAAATTPAQARAIGERWRAEGSAALAVDYANALLSAGLNDDLLTEISERGLFAEDAQAALIYRAEASLRQGRFDAALASAQGSAPAADPYLAFARARAIYALTADASAADDNLRSALRGPETLAAEAWLFRARIALDANDFDAAEAAARRALEAGAGRPRADRVGVEAAIRKGDFTAAATLLDDAAKDRKSRRLGAEDYRLAAMLKLKTGDARSAARLLDMAPPDGDARSALLTALAKSLNGETAQAYGLATGVLAKAPNDWMARDMAAAIARDLGRADEANDHLARLSAVRPALAALRRLQQDGDHDAAFRSMAHLKDAGATGVVAALLGEGAVADAPVEPADAEKHAAALAVAMNAGDEVAMRRGAHASSRTQSALALAIAGAAYARLGDGRRADEVFSKASLLSLEFFAPVKERARHYAESMRAVAAADLLRNFEKRNPGHIDARLEIAVLEARMGAAGAAVKSFAALPAETVFAEEETGLAYAEAANTVGGAARQSVIVAAQSAATNQVLGKVFERLGEDENAARAFRSALIETPESAEIAALYHAAMVRLGRTDEAASLLEARRGGNGAAAAPNSRETAGL